ncbi:excisionase family DNA-binding protein [Rufibacter immobilis]|uniref:excisionase family DNA-binding protein n=1 Tax=Rufibacter immobilis TaxID=1348778 RepID=UPI0035EFDC2C
MSVRITIENGIVSLTLDGEDQQLVIERVADKYAEKLAEQEVLARCYTVAELAKRLNCSRSSVDRLIDSGRIRYVTVGETKGYRITETEVRRFLACF